MIRAIFAWSIKVKVRTKRKSALRFVVNAFKGLVKVSPLVELPFPIIQEATRLICGQELRFISF